ncbi:hypothetical protein WN944_019030 [Citrus x changshan-huyou]|uniref:Uncharacterized protein n=1 Tax=Citrus x changshan-huyou TaxID=2935761 RepID=A0AAP0LXE1_9ROSI
MIRESGHTQTGRLRALLKQTPSSSQPITSYPRLVHNWLCGRSLRGHASPTPKSIFIIHIVTSITKDVAFRLRGADWGLCLSLATSGQKYVVNDFILPGTAYGHTFLGTLTIAGLEPTPNEPARPVAVVYEP